MRGALMMLGVVMHAAYVYSPSHPWVVSDPQPSVILDVVSHYLRMFRMPAFFVIAGFFSLMSLERHGARTFLRTRLKRIGVPLAGALLTLNVVQLYLQQLLLSEQPLTWTQFMLTELPRRFLAGELVQHLWFLNTLLLFFVAAVGVHRFLIPVAARWRRTRWVDGLRRECRFMLLLPCVMAIWPLVERLGHGWADETLLCGFLSPDDFACFFPYFVGGMWLFADPELQEQFFRPAPWQIAAFVPSIVVYMLLRSAHGLNIASFLKCYGEILFTLLTMQGCFILFRKFAARESKLSRYLADGSYTVYLFHHLCVVALGALLIGTPLAPEVKFLVIVITALATTLTIHHFLILRNPLLRFVFNGK